MPLFANCPKCKRETGIGFDFKRGQKMTVCVCGHAAAIQNLAFNPEPEYLFKYRPHDSYSESWIVNDELFFASPASFNDPFDSKVMYSMDGTIQQEKVYLNHLFKTQSPYTKKKDKWKLIKKAVKDRTLRNAHEDTVQRMQQYIDTYGVVSFSQKPLDLLLFAYYAREHTGYCLKYRRTAENVLSMARPVVYEQYYPQFSLLDEKFRKNGLLGDKILFTKAKCWDHEAEWRIGLTNFTTRALKSPHPILDAIILGCNMKPSHRAEIVALNQRRSKPVTLFETRKKKSEFALEALPLIV